MKYLEDQKCFLFEGNKNGQLQAIFIFAKDEQEARSFFLKREDDKSRIRQVCQDTVSSDPQLMPESVKEMTKMMLFSHSYFDESNRETNYIHGFHKMYKFTPLRILYILAKMPDKQETKEVKKKVEVELDLEF